MFYEDFVSSKDHLAHYGVKGMEWGKKNKLPYTYTKQPTPQQKQPANQQKQPVPQQKDTPNQTKQPAPVTKQVVSQTKQPISNNSVSTVTSKSPVNLTRSKTPEFQALRSSENILRRDQNSQIDAIVRRRTENANRLIRTYNLRLWRSRGNDRTEEEERTISAGERVIQMLMPDVYNLYIAGRNVDNGIQSSMNTERRRGSS